MDGELVDGDEGIVRRMVEVHESHGEPASLSLREVLDRHALRHHPVEGLIMSHDVRPAETADTAHDLGTGRLGQMGIEAEERRLEDLVQEDTIQPPSHRVRRVRGDVGTVAVLVPLWDEHVYEGMLDRGLGERGHRIQFIW